MSYEADYYEILQTSREAEPEVIEAAYKRLARKYHPDVNNDPRAASRMKDLNRAYEVLSDSGKRQQYDDRVRSRTAQHDDDVRSGTAHREREKAKGAAGTAVRTVKPRRNARGRSTSALAIAITALTSVGAVGAILIVVLQPFSSGSKDGDKLVLSPVTANVVPVVISRDLAIGHNRFVVGLLDKDDAEVLGAELHLRFFLIKGQEANLKFESDPQPIRITKTYTHTHDDGTVETHEAGETGVYVTNIDFDAAGQWAVEVTGSANSQTLEPVRPVFDVHEKSSSPGAGDPAPRSIQQTLSDVADIKEIDTSQTPIPEMHNMTIAAAVTSGKPTVIVFATPAFCASRVCGPAKQIVDDLYGAYKGQANFIHVEPYDVARVRRGDCPSLGDCAVPSTSEWGLESEPWVFIVDRAGLIAGKYEGVVSYEELEAALKPLLST